MSAAQLLDLARTHYVGHEGLIEDGYELGGKSGFWRASNGTVTGRLVYRQRQAREGVIASVAVTIRGIPLQYA